MEEKQHWRNNNACSAWKPYFIQIILDDNQGRVGSDFVLLDMRPLCHWYTGYHLFFFIVIWTFFTYNIPPSHSPPVPTSASFIHIFIHMHVVHTQIKTKCDTLVICACVLCTIFTLRYERPQYILWRFFSLPSYMYTVWETRSALIRYFVALDLLLSFVLPVFFFFAVLFWLFV